MPYWFNSNTYTLFIWGRGNKRVVSNAQDEEGAEAEKQKRIKKGHEEDCSTEINGGQKKNDGGKSGHDKAKRVELASEYKGLCLQKKKCEGIFFHHLPILSHTACFFPL